MEVLSLRIVLLVFTVIASAAPCFDFLTKKVTIFSDFTQERDKNFFKITFPDVVDKIGERIKAEYHFLDSPRFSGSRICTLNQLKRNIYLQAQYLQCLTENTHEDCLEDNNITINKWTFKRCLKYEVPSIAKAAYQQYEALRTNQKPIVTIKKKFLINMTILSTVENMFQFVCGSFILLKPYGCLNLWRLQPIIFNVIVYTAVHLFIYSDWGLFSNSYNRVQCNCDSFWGS